jgi:hypothetical protein
MRSLIDATPDLTSNQLRRRYRALRHSLCMTRSRPSPIPRLLDADADGADWREVARIVLYVDPKRELTRSRRVSGLAATCRAKRCPSVGF